MGEKPDKNKLLAIARLIIDTCTPEEMNMLCVGILDANLKLKALQEMGEMNEQRRNKKDNQNNVC